MDHNQELTRWASVITAGTGALEMICPKARYKTNLQRMIFFSVTSKNITFVKGSIYIGINFLINKATARQYHNLNPETKRALFRHKLMMKTFYENRHEIYT
jgi:hypothetical protein